MCSPHNTPLFMHENVPAPISLEHLTDALAQRTNKNSNRTPRKGSSPYFEQQKYSREQLQCPESTGNGDHESRYEQRSHFLLLLRKRPYLYNFAVLDLTRHFCCITLLPFIR